MKFVVINKSETRIVMNCIMAVFRCTATGTKQADFSLTRLEIVLSQYEESSKGRGVRGGCE